MDPAGHGGLRLGAHGLRPGLRRPRQRPRELQRLSPHLRRRDPRRQHLSEQPLRLHLPAGLRQLRRQPRQRLRELPRHRRPLRQMRAALPLRRHRHSG
ncbi:MAG: hypothetical protein ACK56F_01795, partial [bacterium]